MLSLQTLLADQGGTQSIEYVLYPKNSKLISRRLQKKWNLILKVFLKMGLKLYQFLLKTKTV